MFGAGYAGAEDRLFFMDVLRNVGRGTLSSFAGGAAGNRAMDEDIWSQAPYEEKDFQRQYDDFDNLYGAEGRQIQADVANYVAGVQAYIAEARINPLKMPGEYVAIGRPQGPENWNVRDVISTATLVGATFGKGGGSELDSALALQSRTQAVRHQEGQRGLARLPQRRGSGGARDRSEAEVPVPKATEEGPQGQRGAARPVVGDQGEVRGGVEPPALAVETAGRAERAEVVPRQGVQRPARVRPRVGLRPAARRLRPPDRLLQPADPDGDRPARPRHRRPRGRLQRREPLRHARARARLRLERDLVEPGHHRHVRRRPL